MENREISLHQLHFDRELQEWYAEGVASRYGLELRWLARRGSAGGAWDVEIPGGQMRGRHGEEVQLLVYEGNPPLINEVRRHLERTAQRTPIQERENV